MLILKSVLTAFLVFVFLPSQHSQPCLLTSIKDMTCLCSKKMSSAERFQFSLHLKTQVKPLISIPPWSGKTNSCSLVISQLTGTSSEAWRKPERDHTSYRYAEMFWNRRQFISKKHGQTIEIALVFFGRERFKNTLRLWMRLRHAVEHHRRQVLTASIMLKTGNAIYELIKPVCPDCIPPKSKKLTGHGLQCLNMFLMNTSLDLSFGMGTVFKKEQRWNMGRITNQFFCWGPEMDEYRTLQERLKTLSEKKEEPELVRNMAKNVLEGINAKH